MSTEGHEGHGVFTWVVVDAFLKADKEFGNRDGVLTTSELAAFVNEYVPGITYKRWGYEQVLQVSLNGREFPIAVSGAKYAAGGDRNDVTALCREARRDLTSLLAAHPASRNHWEVGDRSGGGAMKRIGWIAAAYAASTCAGVFVGSLFVHELVSIRELIAAMLFAPLLNLVPILVAAADERFALTLLCWCLFPAGAALTLRGRIRRGLVIVALTSFLMNLATLPRFWGMMSV